MGNAQDSSQPIFQPLLEAVEKRVEQDSGLGNALGRDEAVGLGPRQALDLDLDEAGDKALNLALAQVADKAVGKAPSKVLSTVLKKPAEMCLAERPSIRPGGRRRGEEEMTNCE